MHIRAAGPGDLNASGDVSPADFAILAGNYGAAVDPITGELLAQDPSLAAAPTGDTNGDGVVDTADLNTVLGSIGQQFGGGPGGGFEFVGDPLTEAEASAVEAGFGIAAPQGLDCKHCALCGRGWCQVLPDRYGEAGGDEPPEFDDGTDGTQPPGGGTGPGGNGGPDPDADDDGDGIANRNDCDSSAFSAGGGGGNCEAPCGDNDGDGVKNQDDCDSECYQPQVARAEAEPAPCDCSVTIAGCPTADGLPVNGVSPTEVIILPDDPAMSATVVLNATGEPADGTYQWFVVGAVADHLDQPTITLTVTNPGEVVASVTYTTNDPLGQPCTARDRCEFLAWRCVIEPTEEVVCLQDPPVPTVLTVNPANGPEATFQWTVTGGQDHVSPDSGTGPSFSTTPEEPGEVTVRCEFVRNGVAKCEKEVALRIPGPVCGANATIVPAFNPVVTRVVGDCGNDAFGRTTYGQFNVVASACYDKQAAQWILRIDSVQQDIAVCVSNGGKLDVPGAWGMMVSAQSYCDILADLTPTAWSPGGPRQQYTSVRCTEEHELRHVQEWKDTFNPIWAIREAAWEALSIACADTIDTSAKALTSLKSTYDFERLVTTLYQDVSAVRPSHANGRTTTYQVQELCHAPLRDAIRQRAQAEGWAPCPP